MVIATPAWSRALVRLTHEGHNVTVASRFESFTFDLDSGRFSTLAADSIGREHFGVNILSPLGIGFDALSSSADGTLPTSASFTVLKRTAATLEVRFGLYASGGYRTTITATVHGKRRGIKVSAESNDPSRVAFAVYLRQFFLEGIFSQGAVQYISGQNQSFLARSPLKVFYTIDAHLGSVAVVPQSDARDAQSTSLLSGNGDFATGIRFPRIHSDAVEGVWSADVHEDSESAPLHGAAGPFSISIIIYPNEHSFPAYRDRQTIRNSEGDVQDLTAYLSAAYANAAGTLGSFKQPGSVYPTLAVPKRHYGDAFNFFDPDAWSGVANLAYSGDPLLQEEARKILERTGAAMTPDGQMPHHFDGSGPSFVSIAGSQQPGPNIFWVLAAIDYGTGTGNESWLKVHYPQMRQSVDWVLKAYDRGTRLVWSDGPLWIDVFRREGYTLDTNVMLVHLLEAMSEIDTFVGDTTSAGRDSRLANDIRGGVWDHLWDGVDHFVTERARDGSVRDFIDYDGNYGAIAFHIADRTARMRLLNRLDDGPLTHPGNVGTWVSERRYQTSDCYKSNDGDSDVTMARIWWLDMAARVATEDHAHFERFLSVMRDEVVGKVWLTERYDASGLPIRANYYHEYPEILAMILREMRYGIHVGVRAVRVEPFGVRAYRFNMGDLDVEYGTSELAIHVPGTSAREFAFGGLRPGDVYQLNRLQRVTVSPAGLLRFNGFAGKNYRLRLAS